MKDVSVIIVGGVVTVAILGIVGHAAIRLSVAAPKRIVGIVLAFAVVLGAIPAILIALYGFSQV
ncbi:hypothetical protein ACWDR1_32145 [Streptosporangium sandarakinum]|uniref:hypothetical protein n=1 Tax=Streptosporangium sandarakinum TaxID=1260955 RepID=UPI00371E8DA6